ncbi:hypothetical protein JCM14202_3552 [Agrilactobacillus composti DSM 18527 = JCM 14202]|uniref:hypothetical protein n=1 Tax=Agrilactobacillus composti TaxID=398555 RepID=UPI00042DE412|nr:hypothetical protein [Agrilactobacillus composti]GAF41600.1 hypothetical protein JCM14202_3552 [Agrilactobacillus composti DSM 18527 = JCM 14202]
MRQLPLHNSSAILGTILAIFLPFIFCNEPSSVQAATSNIDATVQIQTTRQQQPVPSATATNQQNLGLATSQAKTSLSTTAPRSAPLTDNQSADIAISTDTSPIKTTNTTQSTQQIVQTTTPDHPSTTTTDTPPDDVTTDQSQPSPSTDTPETIIPGKTPNSAIATKPDGNDPEQVETQPADTTPTTTTKADEEVINDQINHSQTTSNSANTTTISPSSQNNSLTTSSVNQSTDQTIHPTINGIISNLITDITSFSGAAVVYPFVFTRVAQLMSDFRTLLSPDRYNIDQMWTGLDDKYNPEYSKTFYTEAKDWYDNQVPKETWSVPFYDDTSKSARATYIKNNDSTSTVIYGQGWTTDLIGWAIFPKYSTIWVITS